MSNSNHLIKNFLQENINLNPESKIDINNINNIFDKLVENDKSILPNNIFPTIWECRWFNDITVEGYSKGDLFWYNTENETDFINKKSEDIYVYALNNNYLRSIIKKYNSSDPEIYKMYKQIIDGYVINDYTKLQRLYDIGNNKNGFNIKVSLIDNNKSDLSDSNAYSDLFDISENMFNNIRVQVEDIKEEIFNDHIKNYHLNIFDTDQTDITYENSIINNNYLNSNLDNIKDVNIFNDTAIFKNKSDNGFDYIIKFKSYTNEYGDKQWYRLWKSGYLEHGGIIKVSNNYLKINDVENTNFISVNLNFDPEFKNSIYMYDIDNNSIDKDYTNLNYDNNDNLSTIQSCLTEECRYIINITEIDNSISSERTVKKYNYESTYPGDPLSVPTPDRPITPIVLNLTSYTNNSFVNYEIDQNKNYNLNEVTKIRNDGFVIKLNSTNKDCVYSYYTSGITNKNISSSLPTPIKEEQPLELITTINDIQENDKSVENVIQSNYITKLNSDNLTLTITNYNLDNLNLLSTETEIIPSKINDLSVTELCNLIYDGTYEQSLLPENIESIEIENGINNINMALAGCQNVKSIQLPSTLTTIVDYGFANCSNLTSINLPRSIKTIGNYAFQNCENLLSIKIPQYIKIINDEVFSRCTNLTSITIPKSVLSIGNGTFFNCKKLSTIIIPEKITYFGFKPFYGCNDLTTVIFNNRTIEEVNQLLTEYTLGFNDNVSISCSDGTISLV